MVSMIQQLKNRHYGKSIAVVGSGPTAIQYAGQEDIAIAINQAIALDQHFDYFQCFDTSWRDREEFGMQPEAIRILGLELSAMLTGDPESFLFRYTDKRTIPELPFDFHELTNIGNIAVPAIETALIMGAHRLVVYGIDMNQRTYYSGGGSGKYSARIAKYLTALLCMASLQGIDVQVVGSDDCKIQIPE